MKRIMVIEDDESIAAALELRFRSCGYAVLIANDAIQAVRLAMNSRVDLFVLDISLPAGNGLALAERFQAAPVTKNIPIILITASRAPELRQRAMELNVAGFFEKPYDVDELLPMIERVLTSRPVQDPCLL